MTIVGSTKFKFGLLVAVTFAAAMTSRPGAAYSPEQQQACTPDAMRLCGAFIPDVDRITMCMIQNKSQLSPPCRAFFGPDPEPVARKRIRAHRVKRPVQADN